MFVFHEKTWRIQLIKVPKNAKQEVNPELYTLRTICQVTSLQLPVIKKILPAIIAFSQSLHDEQQQWQHVDNDGRRPAVEAAVDLRCSFAEFLFLEKLVLVISLIYNSGHLIYTVLLGLHLNTRIASCTSLRTVWKITSPQYSHNPCTLSSSYGDMRIINTINSTIFLLPPWLFILNRFFYQYVNLF